MSFRSHIHISILVLVLLHVVIVFLSLLVHAPGVGIFVVLSMLNHNCHPSAQIDFRFRKDVGLVAELVALRDLFPGDDVTISYVASDLSHTEKTQKLLFGYGFNCEETCPHLDLCKT